MIFELLAALASGGGVRRNSSSEEDHDDEPTHEEPAHAGCNNCGRTFHAMWINHYCPARCGGRIYSR
jgi:hypothetical protein